MELETTDELSRRELLALRDIRQHGHVTDRVTAQRLQETGMVDELHDGTLRMTSKGRRMLVRGSPSLWNIAS